jgi:hypothetical protein
MKDLPFEQKLLGKISRFLRIHRELTVILWTKLRAVVVAVFLFHFVHPGNMGMKRGIEKGGNRMLKAEKIKSRPIRSIVNEKGYESPTE